MGAAALSCFLAILASVNAADSSSPTTTPSTSPADAAPATQPKFSECPIAEPLADKTGWSIAPRAKYRAEQVPDCVMIFVEGENPTAAYQVKVAVNPEKIFPPNLTLYRKPPDGMAAQVITPYAVCVKFLCGKEAIDHVVLFDADGRVEIPVEQARD
jgi:hypothetical protein